jgi:hypothetical protein
MSNIYADVMKIAGGDFSVAERRVTEFSEFANTVPAAPDSSAGQETARPAASSEPQHNTADHGDQNAAAALPPEPAPPKDHE